MLKNILLQCAELLNRDDLINEIKTHTSIDEIENQQNQNDILRLISFYNYITKSIFDNYLELTTTENISTDSAGNIYFSKLKYLPIKIIKLEKLSNNVNYIIYPNLLNTSLSNTIINITYRYSPEELKDFKSALCIKDKNIQNTISYGIVSEFLASKNLFSESDFWKNRFIYNLFELKNKKGKYIKPTFLL